MGRLVEREQKAESHLVTMQQGNASQLQEIRRTQTTKNSKKTSDETRRASFGLTGDAASQKSLQTRFGPKAPSIRTISKSGSPNRGERPGRMCRCGLASRSYLRRPG